LRRAIIALTQTLPDGVSKVVSRVARDRGAHSGDLERSIRSIMNTDSGDHEHLLALA
jgi:hypothetical protein